VIDSTSINLTEGATGNGHTGVTAEVIVSPDAGNVFIVRPNGVYVPAAQPVIDLDTNTINTTVTSTGGNWVVSGDVIIDPVASNLLVAGANGLLVNPPTCDQVKTALEGGCIPNGTAANFVAFDATGQLVQVAPTTAAETPLTVIDSTSINLTEGATGNGHTGVTAEVIVSPDTGNILTVRPNGVFVPRLTCADIQAVLLDTTCIPLLPPLPSLDSNLIDDVESVYGVHTDGTVVRQQRRPTVTMLGRYGSAIPKTVNGTPAVLSADSNRLIHDWQAVAGNAVSGDIKVSDVATAATDKPLSGAYQTYKSDHDGVYNFAVNTNLEFTAASADLLTTGPDTYKVANRGWYVVTEAVTNKTGVLTSWMVGRTEIPLTAVQNREKVLVAHNANLGPFTMAKGDFMFVRSWVEGFNQASNDTPVTLSIPGSQANNDSFGVTEVPMSTF
jgi:hypothetical protein